jgi:hypothetical protein
VEILFHHPSTSSGTGTGRGTRNFELGTLNLPSNLKAPPRVLPEAIEGDDPRLEEGNKIGPVFFVEDGNVGESLIYPRNYFAVDLCVELPLPFLTEGRVQHILHLEELFEVQLLELGITVL